MDIIYEQLLVVKKSKLNYLLMALIVYKLGKIFSACFCDSWPYLRCNCITEAVFY